MRLEWIEDILAVQDTGSFRAASELRHLTQSAFTRRIRVIEESLGVELFDRNRKPVRMLPHVRKQEAEMRSAVVKLNALRHALSNAGKVTGNRVSFACQHTITTTISPRLIRQLTRGNQLSVRVRSNNRDACLMMLLTAEVDFAVIYETPGEAVHKDKIGFVTESLGSDWMVPMVARHARKEILNRMRKSVLPVISYPTEVYLGQLFETAFLTSVSSDYQVSSTAETGLALAALQYSLEGVGIGWLPWSIAKPSIEQGLLVDLSDRLPRQELRIKIVRLQGETTSLVQDVWEQIVLDFPPLNQALD